MASSPHRSALHLALALVLVLQGLAAQAMPRVPMGEAPAEPTTAAAALAAAERMPCHAEPAAQPAPEEQGCCATATCHAICASAALPAAVLAFDEPAPASAGARRVDARPPQASFEPDLRPPIARG